MKNIPKINSSKIVESKRKYSGQLLIPKNTRKSNKTPELTDNNKRIPDSKDIFHSQTLQNSTISFDQVNRSMFRLFRNKEEFNNYMIYKKYLCSKTQYHKIISDITELDNKIKENNDKIEKMNNFLNKLKKNKKQKESDIVNLLSNKESLEEIYKSRIYHLRNKSQIFKIKNINGQNNPNENSNENENMQNENIKFNEYNKDNNFIIENNDNCNDNDNDTNQNSSTLNIFEENNYEVNIDEIKISDIKKYEEQVIFFFEELLLKKDNAIRNQLKEKVDLAYQIFFSEINSVSQIDANTIINNFFLRISLFISNQSLGNYSEQFISSFLKQLIKINHIGMEIEKILKFLNKKYKDTKLEIKEKISNLMKKNENLKNKKLSFETKKKELKQFIDENSEFVQNLEKNRVKVDEEHNLQNSFFSDSNLSKNKIASSLAYNDKISNLKREKIRNAKEKILKIKNNMIQNELNKKDENNRNNSKKNEKNHKNNNNTDIINNNSIKEIGKKSMNVYKTRQINMNKILNVNNYQINNTWNNNYSGLENNQSLKKNNIPNNENVNMNNNQIIDNFNNYIINCLPMKASDKRENNIIIRQKIINENKNEINVNNLLINNNINIENSGNIMKNNNELDNDNNKKNNQIYNKSKVINQRTNNSIYFSDNKKFAAIKKINIPNNNATFKNEKLIRVNRIDNKNENGQKKNVINNTITEIKYDNKNRKIFKSQLNIDDKNNNNLRDYFNFNSKKQNSKNIIMLNDTKSSSSKNIISKKNIIFNSPNQNLNHQNRVILQKDISKPEILQNNKNIPSNYSLVSKTFRIPKSNVEKIDTKFTNQMTQKESNLGNYINKQKYLNQKNNYNSNTYIGQREDPLNRKIDISIIEKNKTYSKRYDNRLKSLTQGIKESFCYFKISTEEDNNYQFDPLNNCSSTPENFGYIGGYISIDIINHKFQMIPKITKDNNDIFIDDLLDINFSDSDSDDGEDYKNKSCIGIGLKNIVDVFITRQMKNIIRIYNAYIKYSSTQENININRFLYSRELNDIPMEYNERIKAPFCNFFMFSLIFDKKSIPKVEFIFINYEQFNLWYECLQYITKINSQSQKMINTRTYNVNSSPHKKIK